MTADDVLALISAAGTDEAFVDKAIINATPWIFGGDAGSFAAWRGAVARDLRARTADVFIVGSAATGYSLSPANPGRPFRPLTGAPTSASDIDLALVSPALFEEAWKLLVLFDRRGSLRIGSDDRQRMRAGVYWGRIEQRSVPLGTDAARRLAVAAGAVTRREPTVGYSVSIRVYRVFADLRGYQASCIRSLRQLIAGGAP